MGGPLGLGGYQIAVGFCCFFLAVGEGPFRDFPKTIAYMYIYVYAYRYPCVKCITLDWKTRHSFWEEGLFSGASCWLQGGYHI